MQNFGSFGWFSSIKKTIFCLMVRFDMGKKHLEDKIVNQFMPFLLHTYYH